MKFLFSVILFGIAGILHAQTDPGQSNEFVDAVREGQRTTAEDEEALLLQALVREIEEDGAFEDGEFEGLETALGAQESTEEPASAQGAYGDE
jgi:hypothetical protein